jgi:hypothetical protein
LWSLVSVSSGATLVDSGDGRDGSREMENFFKGDNGTNPPLWTNLFHYEP